MDLSKLADNGLKICKPTSNPLDSYYKIVCHYVEENIAYNS